jgi:hypothetical protein
MRLVAVACMLIAALSHLHLPGNGVPIHRKSDMDGHDRLMGIARDPSLQAVGSWYIGDDPHGVGCYRPLNATVLWLGYKLWGFEWWPYLVINWIIFMATGYAVYLLWRELGMPHLPAVACGALLLALPTKPTLHAVVLVGILHDLLCTLFALLALVLMLRYLRTARAGNLVWCGICAFLAYLSKEMALAMLPLFVVLAVALHHRHGSGRRTARAVLVTIAVAAVWGALYVTALVNMGGSGGAHHDMGQWLAMLIDRGDSTVLFAAGNFIPALAGIMQMVVSDVELLIYPPFWEKLALLLVHVTCYVVLLVYRRPWFLLLIAWQAFTYLPVLPFHDTWPWYRYMPDVLDLSVYVAGIWLIWEETLIGQRGQALLAQLGARLPLSPHALNHPQ